MGLDSTLSEIKDFYAKTVFFKAYSQAPNQGEVHRSLSAWSLLEKQGLLDGQEIKKQKGIYSWMKPTPESQSLIQKFIKKNNIPNPVPIDLIHMTVLSSPDSIAGYKPFNGYWSASCVYKPFCDDDYQPNYYLSIFKNSLLLCFNEASVYHCQVNQAYSLGYKPKFDIPLPPHITLSYNVGPNFDILDIQPPEFGIVFGSEEVMGYQENWSDTLKFETQIIKSDDEQQLVYGWASVVEKDGEPVIDSQGDIIPESVLAKAIIEYMADDRVSKTMHIGGATGQVVESMMFTKELQKTLGIDLKKVGWLIGVKIADKDVWKAVKDGTLSMFSIGGKAQWVEIDESPVS